jgi:hypothetical protein
MPINLRLHHSIQGNAAMRDATFEDIQNILFDCKRLGGIDCGVMFSTWGAREWLAYQSLGQLRAAGETPMEAAMNLKAKLEAVAYRERYQSELLARTLGLEAAE